MHAAHEAGVRHFIHTSVSGTGWRSKHPDVDPGAARNYWNSKENVEGMVRDAGSASWTIVEPAFFMENFIAPKVGWLFPRLAEAELLVATSPATEVALVAAADLAQQPSPPSATQPDSPGSSSSWEATRPPSP